MIYRINDVIVNKNNKYYMYLGSGRLYRLQRNLISKTLVYKLDSNIEELSQDKNECYIKIEDKDVIFKNGIIAISNCSTQDVICRKTKIQATDIAIRYGCDSCRIYELHKSESLESILVMVRNGSRTKLDILKDIKYHIGL